VAWRFLLTGPAAGRACWRKRMMLSLCVCVCVCVCVCARVDERMHLKVENERVMYGSEHDVEAISPVAAASGHKSSSCSKRADVLPCLSLCSGLCFLFSVLRGVIAERGRGPLLAEVPADVLVALVGAFGAADAESCPTGTSKRSTGRPEGAGCRT
jgi:hypothetical protein